MKAYFYRVKAKYFQGKLELRIYVHIKVYKPLCTNTGQECFKIKYIYNYLPDANNTI